MVVPVTKKRVVPTSVSKTVKTKKVVEVPGSHYIYRESNLNITVMVVVDRMAYKPVTNVSSKKG